MVEKKILKVRPAYFNLLDFNEVLKTLDMQFLSQNPIKIYKIVTFIKQKDLCAMLGFSESLRSDGQKCNFGTITLTVSQTD